MFFSYFLPTEPFASFVVNSEPHTGARPSVRLCGANNCDNNLRACSETINLGARFAKLVAEAATGYVGLVVKRTNGNCGEERNNGGAYDKDNREGFRL